MKRTIRLIMLVLAVCLVSPAIASAKDRKQREERRTPEQIAEMQAGHIATRLKLDEETKAKFISVYCELQKEVRAVNDKNIRPTSEMSDEEIESAILARFERSQKILDIRRRGYDEYRKFLSPRQIEQVYRLEKQTKKRLFEHKSKKHKHSASESRSKRTKENKD